jgi:UDP-glucose 4-epimerase
MMTTHIITGHKGYVGSMLAEHLRLDASNDIIGIDMPSNDIRELKSLPASDAVYHLAALVGHKRCMAEPALAYSINAGGTANLYDVASKATTKGMVYASTCAVYGQRETACDEQATLKPSGSAYAISKLNGELIACCYHPSAILRIFNIYGPGNGGSLDRMVFDASHTGNIEIQGSEDQAYDYVHVDDVCSALMKAVGHDGTYNIGTGMSTSLGEVVGMISQELDCDIHVSYTDKPEYCIPYSCAIIDKAKRELKWKPRISVKDGIKQLCRHHQP